jgi:hypothetical protein
MSGLAMASLVQSEFDLRWIEVTQATEVGLILLAVPFVVQLLASVFSHMAGDGAGGAIVGVLATTWAAIGLVHVTSVPGSRSGALGLGLLAAALVLALSAIAVAVGKPLPGFVLLGAAARFALPGIYELGGGAVLARRRRHRRPGRARPRRLLRSRLRARGTAAQDSAADLPPRAGCVGDE